MNKDILWDGTISKLRISHQVYPELFEDLKKIPQRERGERLRLLAYIGLRIAAEFENQVTSLHHLPESSNEQNEKVKNNPWEIHERVISRKNKFLEGI